MGRGDGSGGNGGQSPVGFGLGILGGGGSEVGGGGISSTGKLSNETTCVPLLKSQSMISLIPS